MFNGQMSRKGRSPTAGRQAVAARSLHSCGSVSAPGRACQGQCRRSARVWRSTPDESIRVTGYIADHAAAGVFLIDAQRLGAQAGHAEAVVGKQVVRQLDGAGVLPLVIAPAAQQAVGGGVQNHGALGLVEPEFVILGGVGAVKRDVERRVIADAEPQLLSGLGGVLHREGMVDGLALQPERAGQDKIKGEALCFGGVVRPQLQLDGVALGPEQGVLHIPGKAGAVRPCRSCRLR